MALTYIYGYFVHWAYVRFQSLLLRIPWKTWKPSRRKIQALIIEAIRNPFSKIGWSVFTYLRKQEFKVKYPTFQSQTFWILQMKMIFFLLQKGTIKVGNTIYLETDTSMFLSNGMHCISNDSDCHFCCYI